MPFKLVSNLIAELSLHTTWHKTCCTWWAPDVLHVICTRFCLATWACVLETVCGTLSHSVLTQDQADCVSDPTMFCFLHDSHWNASSFKSLVWRHWFEHQTRCFSDRHLKHQAMEVFRNVQSTFVHSRISQWGTVWVSPHWPSVSTPGAKDPGFKSHLRRNFSRSSHTSDLKIGIPVTTLPGAWH